MVKNSLNNIFSDLDSESSVIIPKSIKIKSIKSTDTISDATSSFMPQKEGYSDATSSFMPQKGGYLNSYNNDINQLVSMLSATSDNNYTTNSTDTEQLKNKLLNIVQEGGVHPMDTDHTHIIYVCCLIDINVVEKIKELIDEQKDNKYRVYINCNPYNIFGFRFQGGVFGETSYSGVIELHRLFRESKILTKDVFAKGDVLTYDIVRKFIMALLKIKIILFDSPDYLLKSWLVEKNININEANEIVEKSQLIDNLVERKLITDFLTTENDAKKQIKKPFDFYETYLKDILYDNVEETYGYDRLRDGKEYVPPIFSFVIEHIIPGYQEKYINKFKENVYKYDDPIRKFEHKRLLRDLISNHDKEFITKTNQDAKAILLELLDDPDVKKACTIFPLFSQYKKFLEIFQKWVTSIRFQQKAPKVLFDFTGFLFICIDGDITNIIENNKIMSDNLVVKMFNVNELQNKIINECKTNNSSDPHDAVIPLIKNIKTKHRYLNKISLFIDCESDDLLTTIACHKHLIEEPEEPNKITLHVYIQRNYINNEYTFEPVQEYLNVQEINIKNDTKKNERYVDICKALNYRNNNIDEVIKHENEKDTIIKKLSDDLDKLIKRETFGEEQKKPRSSNLEKKFIIKNKINLRFILSILEEKIYAESCSTKQLNKNSQYPKLLKELSKNAKKIEETTPQPYYGDGGLIESSIHFISFDNKIWTEYGNLLKEFKDEIIEIAKNVFDEEVKENKVNLNEFFIEQLRLIYPFINQDKIKQFKKYILNEEDEIEKPKETNEQSKIDKLKEKNKQSEDIPNVNKIDFNGKDKALIKEKHTKFDEHVLLLLIKAKKNLKKITFKEDDVTTLFKCNDIPINFNKLYTLYNFYIDKFKLKYNKAKYFNIPINLHDKHNNIRDIIPDIHQLDLTFEFFKIKDSNILINQKTQVTSLSPNILKALDALYQLFKRDTELSKLTFPKLPFEVSTAAYSATKYLKKNIY